MSCPSDPSHSRRQKLLFFLSSAGIVVATYALHVERMLETPPLDYEPYCSTRWGSCTTVFTSSYAHILSHWGLVEQNSDYDISLSVAGILNYSIYLIYPFTAGLVPNRKFYLFAISTTGVLFSCYLIYILKFILREFCFVCAMFHVINFATFFFVALPELASANMTTAARHRKNE